MWNEPDAEVAACAACNGARLKPEALAVRFRGENIAALTAHSVGESRTHFERLKLAVREAEIAEALGKRKAENLKATGADLVATGNIGCLTQIQAYLDLPVLHTAELLALLYEGKDPLA